MCYNCGCDIPEDDMGKGPLRNGGSGLVEDDLQKLATDWKMSLKETKENIFKLLKKQLGK